MRIGGNKVPIGLRGAVNVDDNFITEALFPTGAPSNSLNWRWFRSGAAAARQRQRGVRATRKRKLQLRTQLTCVRDSKFC